MSDDAQLKKCPGCKVRRIVRFSKTQQKWLWETHTVSLDDDAEVCKYSNTDKKAKP
jgi:hypothetical protein